jgi:hypothetical protein
MPTLLTTLLMGLSAWLPTPAIAAAKQPDLASVNAAIARYKTSYGDILSDISCDAPKITAQTLMCNASYEKDDLLWKMGRLDDMAWVYAYENGTKREVDHDDPPRDTAFIKERDACRDVQCVKAVLVRHTNDSLGGESPYYAH